MERDVATRRGLSSFCSDEHMYAHQYEKQKETRVRQAKAARAADIPHDVRQRTFEADGHRCRFCGTEYVLHLHHIKYRSEGGPHEVSNLIVLCLACHELVHTNKGRFQPLLQEIVWRRDTHGDKVSLVSDIEGFDGDAGNSGT